MHSTDDNKPLVSILIACYNGEQFINKCLHSCLEQTYTNIEIIVVNDGSEDDSEKILNWWAEQDSRIKIIKNFNKGLGQTRNILIENCSGEYFTFLDIDDWLNLDSIEKLLNAALKNNYQLVVGRTNLAYDNIIFKQIPFFPSWIVGKKTTNIQYVKTNICTPWASLIKTSFFKSLNISFIEGRIFEDIGVMTYLFLKSNNFCAIKDIVYNYHRHKTNKKQKALSSFKNNSFIKINDIYHQTTQLMDYLQRDRFLETKKLKRIINGCLFQIITSDIFMSKNITKNKYYRYVMIYDLLSLLYSYGLKLRYSKTLWKSLDYLYITLNNREIISHISSEKKWKFYIEGSLKNVDGFALLSSEKYLIQKSKHKIYEISLENLLNFNIDEDSRNCNIALFFTEWNEMKIEKAFSIMYKVNCVPFIIIRNQVLSDDQIKHLHDKSLGIFLDLRFINFKQCSKILEIIKESKREKIIYLISKSKDRHIIDKLDKNKTIINGVFWDE